MLFMLLTWTKIKFTPQLLVLHPISILIKIWLIVLKEEEFGRADRLAGPARYAFIVYTLFELLTKSNVSVIQVSRLMACNVTYNEVLLFWSDITVGARWGLWNFEMVQNLWLNARIIKPLRYYNAQEVRIENISADWYKAKLSHLSII
jgi:hypothetical protein